MHASSFFKNVVPFISDALWIHTSSRILTQSMETFCPLNLRRSSFQNLRTFSLREQLMSAWINAKGYVDNTQNL